MANENPPSSDRGEQAPEVQPVPTASTEVPTTSLLKEATSEPVKQESTQDQLLQDASTLLMFANVAAKQQQEIRQKSISPSPPPAQVTPPAQTAVPVHQSPAIIHQVKHTVFDPVRQIYSQTSTEKPSQDVGAFSLSPGPANVILSRGNDDFNKNNSIIAAAALAQAADNPLPLVKREEVVIAPVKQEDVQQKAATEPPATECPVRQEITQDAPQSPPKQEVPPQEAPQSPPKEEVPPQEAPQGAPQGSQEGAEAKAVHIPPLLEYKVDQSAGIIGCICNIEEDDGFTIQCDICYRWQHCLCMGYKNNEEVPEDEYKCYYCDKQKWGKIDAESCKRDTIRRLTNEEENTKKRGKVEEGSRKKRRIEKKQLMDDFNNKEPSPPPVREEVKLPNKDNELLEDGYSAENYQSTYYKLRSNDYKNHEYQRYFQQMGEEFYKRCGKLDDASKGKVDITITTLKDFKAIPKLFIVLPNHEKALQEHNQPVPPIPDISVQVKAYSDSQKQKFNGISKLGLFLQSKNETTVPKGTPVLEYFGVLDFFSEYRDNKTNQYNVWGTTKPKVLKTSLTLVDDKNSVKPLDVVLDSRFVGNETRFIRKACPVAANCEIKKYYIPEINAFRFMVVLSKDIELSGEEELRLPWEWDETNPIRKLYGDDEVKFDQLTDKEKTLLITTIDSILYFTECGCSTTSNTPLYLPNCAVFKVKKATTYLVRSTRKISGITNINFYKPKDELITPKQPKEYISWEQRLHDRDEVISQKLFLTSSEKVDNTEEQVVSEFANLKKGYITKIISKVKEDKESIKDDFYSFIPITAGLNDKIQDTIKPKIEKSLSEIKSKLSETNESLEKIKVLVEEPVKTVEEPPKPVKKLSFADYKKKMK